MKSSKQNKQKILIIRNDRLGDFMLAWPALALLRENLPKAHIAVLVPAYTQPLAEACAAGSLEIEAVIAALEEAESKAAPEVESWGGKLLARPARAGA